LPKYVHGYADRLGKVRHYYKRTGSKPVALSGLPWSPGFMAAYDAAHAAYEQPMAVALGASRTKVGTLNAALVRYYVHGLEATRDPSLVRWLGSAKIEETADQAEPGVRPETMSMAA
jgi:hypothetical protein